MKKRIFDYDDQFKEDLIHQLYHLVIEVSKMNKLLDKAMKTQYRLRLVSGGKEKNEHEKTLPRNKKR